MSDLGSKFYEQREFYFQKLYIESVIIDSSVEIYMYATVDYFRELHTAVFLLDYTAMNKILKGMGETGIKVSHMIGQALSNSPDIPAELYFAELLGKPVMVDCCVIKTVLEIENRPVKISLMDNLEHYIFHVKEIV